MIFVFLSHGAEVVDLTLNAIGSLRRVNSTIEVFCGCTAPTRAHLTTELAKMNVRVLNVETTVESAQYHDFDSAAFNAITTAKFPLIKSLLNRITSPVVFFDIDIAFVGDPAPYLSRVLERFDICVQTEGRALFPPLYCTGVMGFRPSLFSHQVLDQLDRIAQVDPERVPDGVAFNRLRNADPTFVKTVFPLPETIFCNGLKGHLVNPPPFDRVKDQARPILVHANWMVGVEAKQDYLKSLGLWKLP